MHRKMYFMFLLTLVILCQVDFNLARPNSARGNNKSSSHKSRDGKSKRSWSLPFDSPPDGEKLDLDLPKADDYSDIEDSLAELTNVKTIDEEPTGPLKLKKWLQLETILPSKIHSKSHSDLTLECTAVGSPPPTIHWLKNGNPIESASPFESDHLTNFVLGRSVYRNRNSNGFSMSKVKSKIPLRCLRPEDEGEYTCVADNEGRQMISTTTLHIEDDSTSERRDDCETKSTMFSYSKKGKKGQPAFIMSAESLHMETIGSDIVLACHGAGRPRPSVQWLDSEGHSIDNGKKFQVGQSGNLLIRSLSWNEMGEYTCVVENPFGKEQASTFLYPLMTEESS